MAEQKIVVSVQDRYLIVDSSYPWTLHFNDTKYLDYQHGRYIADLYAAVGSEGSGEQQIRNVWMSYDDGDQLGHFDWQTSEIPIEQLTGVDGQQVVVVNWPESGQRLVELVWSIYEEISRRGKIINKSYQWSSAAELQAVIADLLGGGGTVSPGRGGSTMLCFDGYITGQINSVNVISFAGLLRITVMDNIGAGGEDLYINVKGPGKYKAVGSDVIKETWEMEYGAASVGISKLEMVGYWR